MKKMLSFLGVTTLSVGAITPVINYNVSSTNNIINVTESYTYSITNEDMQNLNFVTENGIEKAILSPTDLKKNFEKCVNNLLAAVDINLTNDYKIEKITTDFIEKDAWQNNDVDLFNKKFKEAKKKSTSLNIKDHWIEIERYKDPNSGISYFVNALAKIDDDNVRLYGSNSYKPIKDLNELQVEFKNTFNLEMKMEISIEGADKEDWGFELPQNIDFQSKEQIINWLMNEKDKVKEHIYKIEDAKLNDIDRPENLYKAIFSNDTYSVGEKIITNDNAPIKDEYFYIGITSKNEAKGEYKMLVKNTKGTTNKIK
ncbi:hypothetical protein [Spiroplasma floricola]|uniref:Uncharacterized protein n=1 Tax=Spiroplasma floricola 23-6 TaxID=1336749 RepID=A0A2K8SEU2_9MOLU|nr:hypothetical protein [Spiroplasma floricola]AUB31961.1 hypothetical protein SFLOR_v1c09130 [Spiroplasma floricola 23-6]